MTDMGFSFMWLQTGRTIRIRTGRPRPEADTPAPLWPSYDQENTEGGGRFDREAGRADQAGPKRQDRDPRRRAARRAGAAPRRRRAPSVASLASTTSISPAATGAVSRRPALEVCKDVLSEKLATAGPGTWRLRQILAAVAMRPVSRLLERHDLQSLRILGRGSPAPPEPGGRVRLVQVAAAPGDTLAFLSQAGGDHGESRSPGQGRIRR